MTKSIGLLLVGFSLVLLSFGLVIERDHGTNSPTGNFIANVIAQPEVKLNILDYIAGISIALSILSMLMGVIFFSRKHN